MSVLRGIELTSFKLILAVALLALLTAVIAAVLLPRTVPAVTREKTADGPARPALRTVLRGVGRYTARTVMVSVPVLLVMVLAGLLINRPMHYVRTVGDAIEAASPRTQVVSRVTPLPEASAYDAAPASAWKASFHDAGDGSQEATWTGPVSGITLPVRVIVPSGYRPDDGRTYNVIEGIHGWVGDPQSLVTGMASPKRLQEAIDTGRIPPSIMVIPSVNVDGSQHDCVSTQRAGWMLMGISAGAYCAARTAYDVPQRFGSVGVMSAFDHPDEGALAHGGKQLQAQNTLSTMLEARKPDGLRFYVMGAQDDSTGSARAAWFMEDAAREPDSVTIDTPAHGGHSWVLWNNYFPSLLTWWGSDPAVFAAAGLPAQEGDVWAKATAAGVRPLTETPRDQRVVGSLSPTRAKPFEINGLGTITVAVVSALVALGTALFWSPRWGRRRDGGKPSVARLGGAILGRIVVVMVTAGLVALAAGIGVNAGGGFYTSWRDLRASVRVSDTAGK